VNNSIECERLARIRGVALKESRIAGLDVRYDSRARPTDREDH
jgi:hypothetical protein